MLQILDSFVGVGAKDLGSKLISMACDDSSIFQDAKIGVITKMKKTVAPFMIKVHCFVQQTNLATLVLLKLSLVAWLEMLLQAMYVFFIHSFKKFIEFQKNVMCP
jgi:fatty acid desaturase